MQKTTLKFDKISPSSPRLHLLATHQTPPFLSNRPSELFSPVGAISTKFDHLGLCETGINLVRLLGHSAAASGAVREIAISPQSRIIRHILITSTQNLHLPQTSIRAFHASPITGDILIPCWLVFKSPQSDQVKRNADLSTTRQIPSIPQRATLRYSAGVYSPHPPTPSMTSYTLLDASHTFCCVGGHHSPLLQPLITLVLTSFHT